MDTGDLSTVDRFRRSIAEKFAAVVRVLGKLCRVSADPLGKIIAFQGVLVWHVACLPTCSGRLAVGAYPCPLVALHPLTLWHLRGRHRHLHNDPARPSILSKTTLLRKRMVDYSVTCTFFRAFKRRFPMENRFLYSVLTSGKRSCRLHCRPVRG